MWSSMGEMGAVIMGLRSTILTRRKGKQESLQYLVPNQDINHHLPIETLNQSCQLNPDHTTPTDTEQCPPKRDPKMHSM